MECILHTNIFIFVDCLLHEIGQRRI